MIKKEEKKIIRTSQNTINSLTSPIVTQSTIIKKIDKSESTKVQAINAIKPKLINRVTKIATIQASSLASKKDVSSNDYKNDELMILSIRSESAIELRKKIKEVEDIQKLNAKIQINLTLSTVFSSDSELSAFIKLLEKVIANVRNLKWVIQGKLKDNGSGQLIGRVLKQCKNLYSLHLELIFPLLDNSALELAQSFESHKGLKILKLWIICPQIPFPGRRTKDFSTIGSFKIQESIQEQLKQLQILEYNNIIPHYLKSIDVFNINFLISSEVDEFPQHSYQRIFQLKRDLAQQIQKVENQITSLNFTNSIDKLAFREIHSGSQKVEEYRAIENYPIEEFYLRQLRLIDQVFELPYLIYFRVSYFKEGHLDYFPKIYPDKKLSKKEQILKALIQERSYAVSSFVLLNKHAFNKISLNPYVLFCDLYFN